MRRSLLEGLPAAWHGGLVPRSGLFAMAGLFAGGIAAMALSRSASESPALAVGLFVGMFLTALGTVVFSALLQTRALRSLVVAKRLLPSDTRAALDAASKALRIGMKPEPTMRAWVIVAQCAEELGELEDADEALRRASASGAVGIPKSLVLHVHLRRAFVRAALGDPDGAEKELVEVGDHDLDDELRAEYTRANALILYRRGQFKDVVDLAASAKRLEGRHRALVSALARSSMLRLDAPATPLRVAVEPAEEEHEAWIERIVDHAISRNSRSGSSR